MRALLLFVNCSVKVEFSNIAKCISKGDSFVPACCFNPSCVMISSVTSNANL